jgi:hypothetical protein
MPTMKRAITPADNMRYEPNDAHRDERTWILPASLSGGRIAQNKYDENEARSDQNGPNPIYALIFFHRRLVLVDGKKSQGHAQETKTREQVQ